VAGPEAVYVVYRGVDPAQQGRIMDCVRGETEAEEAEVSDTAMAFGPILAVPLVVLSVLVPIDVALRIDDSRRARNIPAQVSDWTIGASIVAMLALSWGLLMLFVEAVS
jgi:hypothetical protein